MNKPLPIIDWMQTPRGKVWPLLDPKPEDVDWVDIAHSLSQCNRFSGATKYPYSVAQHCVTVARVLAKQNLPEPVLLHGLLHDAHEALIGDMTTPVANVINTLVNERVEPYLEGVFREALRALKATQDGAIFGAAGLEPGEESHRRVKDADRQAMMVERDALFLTKPPIPWAGLEDTPRPDVTIRPWSPGEAKRAWLRRLRDYGVEFQQ